MRRGFLAVALTAAFAASALTATDTLAATKARTVGCRGTERLCTATVSLSGGASNQLVRVELPGTSWRAPSVSVTPKSSRGAYSISHKRFALGGSEYRFTLNAVQSNPRGAHLTLTFRKR